MLTVITGAVSCSNPLIPFCCCTWNATHPAFLFRMKFRTSGVGSVDSENEQLMHK